MLVWVRTAIVDGVSRSSRGMKLFFVSEPFSGAAAV